MPPPAHQILNSDGKTGNLRSEPNNRNGKKSKEISPSNGKFKSNTTNTNSSNNIRYRRRSRIKIIEKKRDSDKEPSHQNKQKKTAPKIQETRHLILKRVTRM